MKLGEIRPTLAEYKKLAQKGNLVPLSVDIMADHVTPVSLLASKWNSSDHCFLLESVEGGEKIGRYSIVSFEPQAILENAAGISTFKMANGQSETSDEPVLDALRSYMRKVKPVPVHGLPRFFGGAVGYCSYEMVHDIEDVPQTNPDQLGWPTSVFFITGDLFVFDNTQQVLKVIACEKILKKSDVAASYARASKRLRQNLAMLKNIRFKLPVRPTGGKSKSKEFSTNLNKEQFMASVRKAKEHIAAGDIIQVVLSRRSEKMTSASPLDIYRSLRMINPSPYMFALKIKDRAIIGSSPESLVRLEEGIAATRPIAGTRRRGQTPEADEKLKENLLKDPKEIAEHIMLVDLGRNDLGRVCQFGSVRVPMFMKVERYSHVMHIVSEVTGKIKNKKDSFDLLKATFPAGTVSGAPKIRAMEIIDDLENDQRGPYAGALGYISYSGNMDMAITIRTILWEKGKVSIQTGAGLVADSDPASEYQETENKAAAMKETIRFAESGDLFWR